MLRPDSFSVVFASPLRVCTARRWMERWEDDFGLVVVWRAVAEERKLATAVAYSNPGA